MQPSRTYRIGEIAEQTGVSVETLRSYEKRRLLTAPPRTTGGYRLYPPDAVEQVKFIKQAQSLGLTLEDIQQLRVGRQRRPPPASCRKVRDLLTRRIEGIDARSSRRRLWKAVEARWEVSGSPKLIRNGKRPASDHRS